MICPNCKQENADGSVFCAGCGARLDQPPYAPYGQQPYPSYPQQPAKPKKPVNKKLIGILCGAGAAVVLVVVLLIVLLGGKGYETVAKNYAQACIDGDRRAAEAYIYPELEDDPVMSSLFSGDLTGLRVFDSWQLNYTADQIKDELEEDYDLSPRRVGDIYVVIFAVTGYDEEYEEEHIVPRTVFVAQIDGTWYVV